MMWYRTFVWGKQHKILTNNTRGITQGDCLSALLFIFYLAKTIKQLPDRTEEQDNKHRILWSALDWVIDKDVHKVDINPKYSDDISFIRSDQARISQVERLIPPMLETNNRQINKSKTEKYHINVERRNDDSWKKCKYLGSRLDTTTDITQRKALMTANYNTLGHIFISKHVSEKLKLKLFTTHIECIFLYNSELWTLTKTLEQQIDSFHRRILRKVIGIRWLERISNTHRYETTKQTAWSINIFKRRLSWLGHLLRLHKETPARKVIVEACKSLKSPRGRPRLTWMQLVLNDFEKYSSIKLDSQNKNNSICRLETIASNRKEWNALVHSMMLSRTTSVQ